ncbi:ribbon-helix-helix protein, CopG family [bacterium]|nr:ribbon-helix-helix protein, CopG family [bacterium]
MHTNNRPRHYKKRKNKIAETYLIRMHESEKEKIRALAKKMGMTPSKLIRLAIMDTLKECLIF